MDKASKAQQRRQLREDMKRMCDDTTLHDVEVRCQNGSVTAHSFMLRRRTPRLFGLLAERRESSGQLLTIGVPGLDVGFLQASMEKIYTEDKITDHFVDGILSHLEGKSDKGISEEAQTEPQTSRETAADQPPTEGDALENGASAQDISIVRAQPNEDTSEGTELDDTKASSTGETQIDKDPKVNESPTDNQKDTKDNESTCVDSYCQLGSAILGLYMDNLWCDVTLAAGDSQFPCHRAVLCARSLYFSALLTGGFKEEREAQVTIERCSPAAVHEMLIYLYGGTVTDLKVPWVELLCLADMYGIEGLKDWSVQGVQVSVCHKFHVPCGQCVQNTPKVLPYLMTYASDKELLKKALSWCCKYFTKVASKRAFADLPPELLEELKKVFLSSVTPSTAVSRLLQCQNILDYLPLVHWAKLSRGVVEQLADVIKTFLVDHFARVIESSELQNLCRTEAMSIPAAKTILLTAADGLSVVQLARSCTSLHRICAPVRDVVDGEERSDYDTLVLDVSEHVQSRAVHNLELIARLPERGTILPEQVLSLLKSKAPVAAFALLDVGKKGGGARPGGAGKSSVVTRRRPATASRRPAGKLTTNTAQNQANSSRGVQTKPFNRDTCHLCVNARELKTSSHALANEIESFESRTFECFLEQSLSFVFKVSQCF